MRADFLERVYLSASSGCFLPSLEGRLSGLWESLGTAEEAEGALLEALDGLKMDEETEERMTDLFYTASTERERQGFFNGFRMGMRLAGELAESEARPTRKGGPTGEQQHAGI